MGIGKEFKLKQTAVIIVIIASTRRSGAERIRQCQLGALLSSGAVGLTRVLSRILPHVCFEYVYSPISNIPKDHKS